ncbi:hypothetical protein CB1_000350013 [Camelus ferus]|nr:hypothetical protein CB1_000350013 [Camelus ferus]
MAQDLRRQRGAKWWAKHSRRDHRQSDAVDKRLEEAATTAADTSDSPLPPLAGISPLLCSCAPFRLFPLESLHRLVQPGLLLPRICISQAVMSDPKLSPVRALFASAKSSLYGNQPGKDERRGARGDLRVQLRVGAASLAVKNLILTERGSQVTDCDSRRGCGYQMTTATLLLCLPKFMPFVGPAEGDGGRRSRNCAFSEVVGRMKNPTGNKYLEQT